jgi:hypothetical protein
MWPH